MQLMIVMMMMSRGGGYALSGITIRGICVVQVKVEEEKRRARFMSCKGLLLLLLYVHFLGNPLHSYELFTIIRHTCPPGCSAAVKVHSRDIN